MLKFLKVYSIFLMFIFITSCQGQKEVDPPKTPPTQTIHPVINLPEVDPYFTENEGINSPYGPKSITRNILQDRNGDLWFATWEGIFQYDGVTFTNHTNKEGLRRYRVFTILEDKKGNLWFGTIGAGIYRYDGKEFTNITTEEGLVNDKIICLYEDKSERIWIGTTEGISLYDGKTFRNFTTEEGLIDNEVNSIIEDRNGKFWFGSRGYAFTFDGKAFTKFTNEQDKSFVNVRSIIEDANGNIWLGGNDGLWRYNPNDRQPISTNVTTDFTGYIYEDRKGNIWTSSDVRFKVSSLVPNMDITDPNQWAISRYDKELLSDEMPIATEIRREGGMFFGIIDDADGNIWFGSLKGACRYDGTSFDYFKDKVSLD